MVQCFGKAFHYKDVVESFLVTAGVRRNLVRKYRDEAKFVWARHVLTDLGESRDGCLVQRRVLTELCNLRKLPDPTAPDPHAGLDALRALKQLAIEKQLVAEEEIKRTEGRARIAQERARLQQERANKLQFLSRKFGEAVTNTNRQKSGYTLEELLKELFPLFELEYATPYRTETQQIDGKFILDGFHYLVEARWRSELPTEQDIGGFKQKVDTKLASTRGLFISVPGFRSEVVQQFDGRGANIILMDGQDITFILEGRFDLRDALRYKIERASRDGNVLCHLNEMGC
jgi:hypothetical protein